MSLHAGGDEGGRGVPLAAQRLLYVEGAIDGLGEGLPHLRVVEGRFGHVEVDPALAQPRGLDQVGGQSPVGGDLVRL